MTTNSVRFRTFNFVNPVDGRERRAILASKKISSSDDEVIENIGIAICNPNDRFSRKEGQKIAYGRLLNRKGMTLISRKDSRVLEDYNGIIDINYDLIERKNFVNYLKHIASNLMLKKLELSR